MKFYISNIIFLFILCISITTAHTARAACTTTDKLCIMAEIKNTAATIKEQSWRDKAYRELAKSYTYAGHEDKAIALIADIKTPDTKAMTIRGIGMAAADSKWKSKILVRDQKRYNALFTALTLQADNIEHLPSRGIAYTYIAMAQAFAKDDDGAMITAKSMKNDALRNKAFGESAEIQAERGDFDAAMASIAEIGLLSFRNKAHATISRIFTKKGKLDDAYDAAQKIDNAYLKSQVLQTLINYGNDEETLPDTTKNKFK